MKTLRHYTTDRRVRFILIVLSLFTIYFLLSTPLLAQDSTEYKMLAPLPLGPGNTNADSVTANSYIPGIIQLIIGVAGVLAVVKIIFGGIQYMSTDAIGGKSEGKSHITNALWGLLLIISAYVILYTLNPNLVNLNLQIEGLRSSEVSIDLGPPGTSNPGDDPSPRGPSYGAPWGDDSAERAALSNVGVEVKTPACTTIGQTGCTSVWGLPPGVISELGELRKACGNCPIVVTGGTEYWLHGNRSSERTLNGTAHGARATGGAVDLRKGSVMESLNSFITSRPRTSGSCSSLGTAYTYRGAVYVNEGNHWHVCFR